MRFSSCYVTDFSVYNNILFAHLLCNTVVGPRERSTSSPALRQLASASRSVAYHRSASLCDVTAAAAAEIDINDDRLLSRR